MTAKGSIVTAPLAAAAALNATAIPSAQAAYALMTQVLQDEPSPLIFGSLALSAGAIVLGLEAYGNPPTG
ncbi:hypothetical protein J7361_20725 [Xanthomonas phaseoli pv. dieffenbachiae]|uniref:hypothetical protein n=2 Tax=Xanthomonas phaseoli TaxID=1985254 RepID=UPI001ADC7E28|nr:hypothetical protein [Xanthomonas phaseoli]MBO9855059.1 hypothetical protein [Xanthomonas phaseoli pv. dieffenbachiae]MBO9969045.1 hypothetical protein [Xanthomonas phaseoli pv. dieffenbachiae]MBO9989202.1 hypothetical protein [Xanthomonas phaseoli pv. dieffenbachiae]